MPRATSICLCATVLACSGAGKPASVPDAGPAFQLTVPQAFRPVVAEWPLEAAWEGPTMGNGFTPTINVMTQPRLADPAYEPWLRTLLEGLRKQYVDVGVVDQLAIEAGPHKGKLVVLLCQLAIPGNPTPMPLYAYGALFEVGDRLYTVGAMTGARLDAATGKVTPIGEGALLAALRSFRVP